MESRLIPIVPFSPICLIDPTLPQCTDYIFGVGPANCSGVSNECENELFRLNKSLSLDLNFVSFIANNLPCDEDAIQPCWEGNNKSSPPVGVNTGRFKQGSCTIDCKQNISRLEQICKNQTGFLCDSEYNVGLDGTELKVILPVCLPEVCRKTTNGHIYQNDLRAIEYCMNQHTCGSLSPKSRALIPECTVTLPGCLEPSDIFHFIVLYFLSFLSILIIFLGCFKCVRGRISRNNKNISTSKAKYYVTSTATATATATATKSFSSEGKVDSLNTPLMANEGSKYVLSDDLANQQQHGRFALGDRRDSRASTSIHDYQIGSSLTYRNLFFRYLGRRLILRGVSGILKRGSCVAVIGAPDSGTTTLLRCLAGRQPKGKVEGSLLIDGKLPDRKITRIIAYIPKEDICHGSLTVRETLDFSARCRLPRTVSTEERNSRCDAWLELLGLTHVSNSIVGDANIRGISGGERRRVSIGISTVAGHRLVIADSPTNGLDSDAAFNVIKTMRALADAHHNGFMVSVRQPSERLLKLFDTICLMSKGKCIFWGRLHEAVPFMEKVHLTKPLRKSLPDFLEELTGKPSKFLDFSNQENQEELGSRSTNRNSKVTAEIIHRKYVESELYERMGKEMWNAVDDSTSLLNFADDLEPASCCPSVLIDDDGKFFFNTEKYSTGCGFQVAAVCGRQIKLISRSPTVRARISRAIFQGFLLGTMFYHFDQSQSAANNRFGALFISLSAIVMGSVSTIPELSSQRRVFYLEKRSGYFRPLVWQLSLILSEIPIALVEMAAYSTLLYGLCDLREGILSLPFLYFYLSLVITSLICWSVAAIAVMASESVVAAQALVPVYNAANLLFSGYLLSKAQIPSYLQWLTVTSTVTRPFVGIAINEMKEQIFHCEDNGKSFFVKKDSSNL
jgi:ABC-type multidrug transport system ATPase subunit